MQPARRDKSQPHETSRLHCCLRNRAKQIKSTSRKPQIDSIFDFYLCSAFNWRRKLLIVLPRIECISIALPPKRTADINRCKRKLDSMNHQHVNARTVMPGTKLRCKWRHSRDHMATTQALCLDSTKQTLPKHCRILDPRDI